MQPNENNQSTSSISLKLALDDDDKQVHLNAVKDGILSKKTKGK